MRRARSAMRYANERHRRLRLAKSDRRRTLKGGPPWRRGTAMKFGAPAEVGGRVTAGPRGLHSAPEESLVASRRLTTSGEKARACIAASGFVRFFFFFLHSTKLLSLLLLLFNDDTAGLTHTQSKGAERTPIPHTHTTKENRLCGEGNKKDKEVMAGLEGQALLIYGAR
jgi:hypothetical protein